MSESTIRKRGTFEDIGDRVAAAMDSNIYGMKDDGTYGFTTHPGIVDNTMGLLNLIPAGIHLGAQNWREAGHDKYADTEDSIANWIDQHLPESVKKAPERHDQLNNAIHEKMGLSNPEGFVQNASEALGNMLTQLPISKAGKAVSGVKTALKAIPEYLGPTIRPSVGNYVTGAVAGGALPEIPDALQYLADKYDSLKRSMRPQNFDEYDNWDKAHPVGSIMPGMASGGSVDLKHVNDPLITNPLMSGSAAPSSVANPVSFPTDMDFYNHYGFGPEHNWGMATPQGVPMAQGFGSSPSTSGGGGAGGGGSKSNLSISDLLSAYKAGKGAYSDIKSLYNSLFGDKGGVSGEPGTAGSTATGTSSSGSPYQGTQTYDSAGSQLSNPSSGGSGTGSLSNLIGGGASIGTIAGDISAVPTGTVTIGEIGDAVGTGAGAGSAGVGAGADAASAGTAAGSVGTDAAADASAAGSASSGTLGTTAGPIATLLAILNMRYGDEAYGSHVVSGGDPLPGQKVVPIPNSPQSMLTVGDLGRGYGNDASKGSGQWFYTGDQQYYPQGQDGWFGKAGTSQLDGYMYALDNVLRDVNNKKLTPDKSGNYVDNDTDFYMDTGSSDGTQYYNIPYTRTYNPNTGAIQYSSTDPNAHINEAEYNALNNNISVQNLYDEYGGQKGWGTDFQTWLKNAYGIYHNQSGKPSGG